MIVLPIDHQSVYVMQFIVQFTVNVQAEVLILFLLKKIHTAPSLSSTVILF